MISDYTVCGKAAAAWRPIRRGRNDPTIVMAAGTGAAGMFHTSYK